MIVHISCVIQNKGGKHMGAGIETIFDITDGDTQENSQEQEPPSYVRQ